MKVERDVRVDERAVPGPCPVCGGTGRLFTPNARRHPYEVPPLYEPAWQCVICGYLDFIAGAPAPRG